jgi:hypothetical protein
MLLWALVWVGALVLTSWLVLGTRQVREYWRMIRRR